MHIVRFPTAVAAVATTLLYAGMPASSAIGSGPVVSDSDGTPARLVVSDAGSGSVAFLDAGSGDVVGVLDATGPASLTSDGHIVYATDHEGGTVTLMDGGSWDRPHGDHTDAIVEEPAVLGVLEGLRPAHVVPNEDYIAVFFDGVGRGDVFAAHSLNEGDLTPELVVETALPHHGLVVVVDNHLLVSIPGATEEDLPVGIEVRSADGEIEAEFPDCPEMHGEAGSDGSALFACADGVQVVQSTEAGWESTNIPYPEGTPAGDRTWSFAHDHESPVLAGVLGESAVLVLDGNSGDATRVDVGGTVVTTAIADDGGSVLALTADGDLHRIEVATGEVTAGGPVIGPIDLEGDGPQPVIAVVDDVAFVTDTVGAVVSANFEDEITVTGRFALEFAPGDMVVVGD